MVIFLILHYKTISETRQCVESILNLKPYPSEKTGIMIVDNASNDGTGEQLQKEYESIPNIKVLILKETCGFSGGNNYGYNYLADKSKIKQMIVCNNDIVFTQADFMEKLDRIYRRSQYAVCGPNVYKITESGKKVATSPLPSPAITKEAIIRLHTLRGYQISQREQGLCRESSMWATAKEKGLYTAIVEWYMNIPMFLWYELTQKLSRVPIKIIRTIENIEMKMHRTKNHIWGGTASRELSCILSRVY